ncbi:hypothetical protein [Pseudomonas sp. DR48]|nr:hypothetical protein [Pseudomonas sp. DR48]QZP33057.1 hypothetical protein K5K95_01150 [Pseudomonas sp. DR48]
MPKSLAASLGSKPDSFQGASYDCNTRTVLTVQAWKNGAIRARGLGL